MKSEIIDWPTQATYDFRRTRLWKISIDCTGVEDVLDVTMAQRSELDYLIYNDPLGYADLILNGDPEEYLETVVDYWDLRHNSKKN